MCKKRILVINPGSTSTKIALFENEDLLFENNYTTLDAQNSSTEERIAVRRNRINEFLLSHNIKTSSIHLIASRGGGGGNFRAGAYIIDEDLVAHCLSYKTPHASSLGPVIAFELSKLWGIPAFVYDAEGVNEFNRFATLSGMKAFPVTPGSHTLNAKAAARLAAVELGGKYEDLTLIVCHMGGGISTSLHLNGKLVDSTSDAYSPERSGGMPMMAMVEFTRACYSGEYTLAEMLSMQFGGGGLAGYLGTSDLREVEARIANGDQTAEYYLDGMIYQLVKDIGGMIAAADFLVDGIVFTGGMAFSDFLMKRLQSKIQSIAPVIIKPGSFEMHALASGALRASSGLEEIHYFRDNINNV